MADSLLGAHYISHIGTSQKDPILIKVGINPMLAFQMALGGKPIMPETSPANSAKNKSKRLQPVPNENVTDNEPLPKILLFYRLC
jgi:hypothetical protein